VVKNPQLTSYPAVSLSKHLLQAVMQQFKIETWLTMTQHL
jgi:hypothetical protein